MEFVQPIRDPKKIEAMKKVLKSTSLRDYCLFVLGINSGLRISDLLSLSISDVMNGNKIKDRISIREQKTRKRNKEGQVIKEGKVKDFPLGDTSRKALKEYLDSRGEVEPDDPLFASRKGEKAITRQRVWTILNETAKTVGIDENIGTHTLRKTFAYQAYKQGADISRIQDLLNHSSQKVTLRYMGITQDEKDDIYLNLNL